MHATLPQSTGGQPVNVRWTDASRRRITNGAADRAPQPRNVSQWAVGVTTAPRRKATLERCLKSLAAAGWETPRLFAEPGVKLPRRFAHLPRTHRDATVGAFPNWYLALAELVMREPRAEAYLLVQDDVVFARNIREFLEVALWPHPQVGVVSIYCPSDYAQGLRPGFHVEDRGWNTWTAQALIFPNPSARAALASPIMLNHRHHGPRQGMRNIDCAVGAWCLSAGRPFYVFTPSLAEHVGDTSTLFRGARTWGRRRSATFVGKHFDVAREANLSKSVEIATI